MAVGFAKVKIPLVALCVAFLALAPRAGAQCNAQRITLKPGEALLVGATDISDWSGALFVSPMTGLDFGTDAVRATLSIRNDGDEPRTVSLELRRAVAELDARVPPPPLRTRSRVTHSHQPPTNHENTRHSSLFTLHCGLCCACARGSEGKRNRRCNDE